MLKLKARFFGGIEAAGVFSACNGARAPVGAYQN
jgi:hypothetical protein